VAELSERLDDRNEDIRAALHGLNLTMNLTQGYIENFEKKFETKKVDVAVMTEELEYSKIPEKPENCPVKSRRVDGRKIGKIRDSNGHYVGNWRENLRLNGGRITKRKFFHKKSLKEISKHAENDEK